MRRVGGPVSTFLLLLPPPLFSRPPRAMAVAEISSSLSAGIVYFLARYQFQFGSHVLPEKNILPFWLPSDRAKKRRENFHPPSLLSSFLFSSDAKKCISGSVCMGWEGGAPFPIWAMGSFFPSSLGSRQANKRKAHTNTFHHFLSRFLVP